MLNGSLGTGQHINLFEEAEQEQRLHVADQEKQLRYTQTNNELIGESKKRLFSEFDEVVASVPWYAKSRQSPDDTPLAQEHPVDDGSTLWYTRHGQRVTSHSLQRGRSLPQGSAAKVETAAQLRDQPSNIQGEAGSARGSKRGKAKQEALELSKLRTEREQREREEAARAAQLMAKHSRSSWTG